MLRHARLAQILAIALLGVLGGVVGLAPSFAMAEPAPDRATFADDGRSIIYDGEVVRLSREYRSYESYVRDRGNIDRAENAHVEILMTRASLPRRFPDGDSAFYAVMALKFPGYGVASLSTRPDGNPAEWRVIELEIPRSRRTRYLAIAEDNGGGWSLIDDFVADDRLRLASAERIGDQITYRDRSDNVVFVHARLRTEAP